MSEVDRRDVLQVESASFVVFRVLRRTFLNDFHRRYMYAPMGIRYQLGVSGIDESFHGGEFLALVV